LLVLLVCTACSRNVGLPQPGSPQYSQLVSAFYVGLAGLQTGADEIAKAKLTQATQIAPGEPASWADLGVLALRQQDFDTAYKNAGEARSRLPDNSRIEELLGTIESKRGKPAEAIGHFKKAASDDPKNLKALYALAEETERQAADHSDAAAEKLFAQVLAQRPNNLAALLEVARLAAKAGDSGALGNAVSALAAKSVAWPDAAKQQMGTLQQSATGANSRGAALRVMFLRNTLVRVPQFRQDLNEVKTPAELVSDPFTKFLKLPSPASEPAAADLALKFEAGSLPNGSQSAAWVGAMPFDDTGKTTVVWANDLANNANVQIDGGAKLPFPGGKNLAVNRNGILPVDLNYDFKNDLVFAGAEGIRIFLQKDLKNFVDVTAKAHLPANIANGAYSGAWAFDVDLDGDLDIALGAADGDPIVLRNNADGTFAVVKPFAGVPGLKAFASADIDGDGAPDAAMIDRDGRLHVFSNQRLGQFRERALPPGLAGRFEAVIAADVNADGRLDFVLLRDDGAVLRLSDKDPGADKDQGAEKNRGADKDQGAAWDFAEIAKAAPVRSPSNSPVHSPTLIAADFDNNGSIDLLIGDGEIFLGGVSGFTRLPAKVDLASASVADLNGDGRLDLIGLSRGGAQPAWTAWLNHGAKNYHWQNIRLRAAETKGDQRINSFGLGGEIEVRAGLLAQTQVIASPVLHFGIGEHPQADVARIIWPNGAAQAEFELKADAEILSVQRLKGSCPWLFAWDGKRMSFVKDAAPWSPALGLHIDAQKVAGIYQTQEWFKIPSESLQPRDGYYDLRITAELWETFYIDHYSLLVVDHPEGTQIYSDERFDVPPPPLKIYSTSEPQPFASARDDRGDDVSATVRDLDRKYLDTFGRGPYQGLTRDHWVELELPESAPIDGPLYLIGSGWLHPTDATVNIAIGQNSIPQPEGLAIEVCDEKGHWKTARQGLGFPAGKMKTVVLDLTGLFHPGAPRRLRLRTNLEIYWDQLQWAAAAPDRNHIQHLSLAGADLRYRGFSVVKSANRSSPELPDYDTLMSSGTIWHNLEGYATRYGDVRELLEKIDDRMVIVNAGDELRLRFAAPPAPAAGWKRDYVLIGDGWIKDGDLNTVFSKTILPLPYHGMKDYTIPPGQLEDDPSYKLHPADWQNFHTRYVTPDAFRNALRN
jgi:Tfp pilus assembly protein PilF